MSTVLRRRVPPTLTKAAVIGGVAFSALATPGIASAAYFGYWNGPLNSQQREGGDSVGGYLSTFNGSDGPNHKIEAAAHHPGGWNLHGSWVDGWDHACHGYDGSRTLGGMIRNPHNVGLGWTGGMSYYLSGAAC